MSRLIKLTVAKCWDPYPDDNHFSIPKNEPIQPIDPAAWANNIPTIQGVALFKALQLLLVNVCFGCKLKWLFQEKKRHFLHYFFVQKLSVFVLSRDPSVTLLSCRED